MGKQIISPTHFTATPQTPPFPLVQFFTSANLGLILLAEFLCVSIVGALLFYASLINKEPKPIPQKAIELLRRNPGLAKQFEKRYGVSAKYFLTDTKPYNPDNN